MDAEDLEAGTDCEIIIAAADEDATVLYDVTVEHNTIGSPEDHIFGLEKLKAYTSKTRTGLNVIVEEDGSAKVRTRHDGNGVVRSGDVVEIR